MKSSPACIVKSEDPLNKLTNAYKDHDHSNKVAGEGPESLIGLHDDGFNDVSGDCDNTFGQKGDGGCVATNSLAT